MKRIEKAAKTKHKIISVAEALFFEKGYASTTMQDLMNITGLSKGALYHHFKSKEDILAYIIKERQTSIKNLLLDLVNNNNLSAQEKIFEFIMTFLSDDSFLNLTKSKWVEKIPFALLETLRNSLNILSDSIEKIIIQGNLKHEFECQYTKEISDLFLLLCDIWLDPLITKDDFDTACNKLNFMILLFDSFKTPLISKENQTIIKERMKKYYE